MEYAEDASIGSREEEEKKNQTSDEVKRPNDANIENKRRGRRRALDDMVSVSLGRFSANQMAAYKGQSPFDLSRPDCCPQRATPMLT